MACEETSEQLILEDTFLSYPSLSSDWNLRLTEKLLRISYPNRNKNEEEIVTLNDVIGCQILHEKIEKPIASDSEDISAYICIYYYPLKVCGGILSKQLRRERRAITFVMRKHPTHHGNLEVVNKWRTAMLWLIRKKQFLENGEVHIPDIPPSYQKLLILVNPKSGCGKAYQIFKERVVPLLKESDMPYEYLVTDRANCARDYMKTADLSQWSGVVLVSGDGLLFEVYNGIMSRCDWKDIIKIPVGVIPGGSGNGLARSISHAAGEPYDVSVVTPSVLNIIRGRVSPMDLVRVQTTKETFYSFLSVGWGLMADIDIESERLRAFGEARFAVWAVIRALGLRKYKGRLSYLPVIGYEANKNAKTVAEPKPKRSKTLDSRIAWSDEQPTENARVDKSTLFRSKSFGMQEADIEENENAVKLIKYKHYTDESLDVLPDDDLFTSEYDNNISHDHCSVDDTKENDPSLGNCSTSEPRSPPNQQSYCSPLADPVPDDWVVIEDDFVLVYACYQTHLSTDVLFAPDARLDDGIMWLIVIRSGVSRAQVMYFLASLQTGDHVHVPYVDVTPIHAFRLEPSQQEGFLTVDGEVIPCGTIQAEVLPSVARVMSR